MLFPPLPQGVHLDRMQIEDVDIVVALDQITAAAQWTFQMFMSEMAAKLVSTCLVVRTPTGARGYLITRMILDELHVMNVAVHPHWQRRGLGTALLCFALFSGKKQGMRLATLEVRCSNLHAQHFYQKFGFRKVGLRKDYYRSPIEDAIILTYDGHLGRG